MVFGIIQKNHIDDIIYGGTDGIITTFAIVAGSFGSKQNLSVAFILGLANLFADGVSMGISSYQSIIHTNYKMEAFLTGLITFISFVSFGIIPLLVFIYIFYVNHKTYATINSTHFLITIGLSLCSLTIVGFIKGYYKVNNSNNLDTNKKLIIFKTILQMLLLGCLAGGIAFYVGYILQKKIEN
jgi:vacuolar iron transporter family protein